MCAVEEEIYADQTIFLYHSWVHLIGSIHVTIPRLTTMFLILLSEPIRSLIESIGRGNSTYFLIDQHIKRLPAEEIGGYQPGLINLSSIPVSNINSMPNAHIMKEISVLMWLELKYNVKKELDCWREKRTLERGVASHLRRSARDRSRKLLNIPTASSV